MQSSRKMLKLGSGEAGVAPDRAELLEGKIDLEFQRSWKDSKAVNLMQFKGKGRARLGNRLAAGGRGPAVQ